MTTASKPRANTTAKVKAYRDILARRHRFRRTLLVLLGASLTLVGVLLLGASRAASPGTVSQNGCAGAPTASEIAAIEQQIGIPLSQVDLTSLTDDQIKAAGYDPAVARELIDRYKSSGGDIAKLTCVAPGSSVADNPTTTSSASQNTVASGTSAASGGGTVVPSLANLAPTAAATNLTAQASLDLSRGGWLVDLRWQAPGGAQKFHIYGRDNGRHPADTELAVVGPLERRALFGGFGQLVLPTFYDRTFTITVVPQVDDVTLGTPVSLETHVRCTVWCWASSSK